jgi:hypothetical protein
MGRALSLLGTFVLGLICSPFLFPDGVSKAIIDLADTIRSALPFHN